MQNTLNYFGVLLDTLGINFDTNGLAIIDRNGTTEPVIVENKRLVMPNQTILATPNWEQQIAFQPFSEQYVRGESEIIVWLRDRMIRKLSTMLAVLIVELTEIACSAERQKALTPDQLALITELGKCDERTALDIGKLIVNANKKGSNSLINIYLKRDGHTLGGLSFRRLAVVTFPILDELDTGSGVAIHGVAMRVADKTFLRNLILLAVPGAGDKEHYNVGSNADTAPYFEVLVKSYAEVVRQLSARFYVFRKHLAEFIDMRVNPEAFDGWDAAVKDSVMLPTLPGNDGKIDPLSAKAPTVATQAAPTYPGAAPAYPGMASFPTVAGYLNQPMQPVMQMGMPGMGMSMMPGGMPMNYGNMPPVPGGMPMMGGGGFGFDALAGMPRATMQPQQPQMAMMPGIAGFNPHAAGRLGF